MMPLRGDKMIRIAKGRLKDVILEIQPVLLLMVSISVPQLWAQRSVVRLQDLTSNPTSAIGNKVLFLIAS